MSEDAYASERKPIHYLAYESAAVQRTKPLVKPVLDQLHLWLGMSREGKEYYFEDKPYELGIPSTHKEIARAWEGHYEAVRQEFVSGVGTHDVNMLLLNVLYDHQAYEVVRQLTPLLGQAKKPLDGTLCFLLTHAGAQPAVVDKRFLKLQMFPVYMLRSFDAEAQRPAQRKSIFDLFAGTPKPSSTSAAIRREYELPTDAAEKVAADIFRSLFGEEPPKPGLHTAETKIMPKDRLPDAGKAPGSHAFSAFLPQGSQHNGLQSLDEAIKKLRGRRAYGTP